jgi:hypothetical protein
MKAVHFIFMLDERLFLVVVKKRAFISSVELDTLLQIKEEK